MSITQEEIIANLSLDLKNYRTTPQTNELDAIHAMISVNQSRFYAIMESLLDDEYIPTENIIVQKIGKDLIVREGNRRIAAMKLILGLHEIKDFQIPESIISRVKLIDKDWKERNESVPCSIYNEKESEKVDRIVSLTHGKGDKASRDPWTSVARARHNRDVNGAKEDGLNLLESYIEKGRNINAQQKERWAGDFGITVLDAALAKAFPRFNYANVSDLVSAYPNIQNRDNLEEIILAIGLENLGFKEIRDENTDFMVRFGFQPVIQSPPSQSNSTNSSNPTTPVGPGSTAPSNSSASVPSGTSSLPQQAPAATPTPPSSSPNASSPATQRPSTAAAINTQRHVNSLLKKFKPRGNRPKVVTLRDELLKLKIKDNPIAFCFVLRSMFEISAKAYCKDKNLPTTARNKEKTLSQLLTQVTGNLTNGNQNTAMARTLHGALTEITTPNRILSVTSMNQLVHSQTFSIQPGDICTLFNNIYPLLEAMN